jgi:mono/diheme cytochrome c family protein
MGLLACLLPTRAMPADGAEAALLARGQYLATAGDCVACHTGPAARPFAGGLLLPTPVGNIVSTNITPSRTHGIGNYTLAQFTDALRKGIRADGKRLYPAMPYTAYALVTDADAAALYAYFMHGVTPVDSAPPPTALPFPFNLRLAMAGWNLLYLDSKPFQPDPARSAPWNRGAYLGRGLAHCGACHTPRNPLMAEDASRELAGGFAGPWYAPNITPDAVGGIGGWTEADIVRYLRTGDATSKAQAAGPMAEAIDHSLRHLSDADLAAIATWIKSVPPLRNPGDTRPASSWGARADDLASIRGMPLPADLNRMTGPQLYDAHCATCHQAHAEGSFDARLPALFHNAALGRPNANNLVMVILAGIERQPDTEDPRGTSSPALRMPAFADALSDQQVATLASYLTKRYGNPDATVTAEQVKLLRDGGVSTDLIDGARLGISAAGLAIFGALVFRTWRARRNRRRR